MCRLLFSPGLFRSLVASMVAFLHLENIIKCCLKWFQFIFDNVVDNKAIWSFDCFQLFKQLKMAH